MKPIWATIGVVFALVVTRRPFGVWAQTNETMAACPTGWEWSDNSLNQDPCTIASLLDAACRSYGEYFVPALGPGQGYLAPSKNSTYDLVCDCDTVMYSLYMGCTACQGGIIYGWGTWEAQCTAVYVAQYPHDIPHGTAIPRWAFYNVTLLPDQIFDSKVAMSIGQDPEATPSPLSTMVHSSNTETSLTSTNAHNMPTTSSTSGATSDLTSDGSSKDHTGAIVGGIVGGIVPLIILGVVVFLFFKHRERKAQEMRESYIGQPPTSPALTATSTIPSRYTTHYNTNGAQPPPQYTGAAEV